MSDSNSNTFRVIQKLADEFKAMVDTSAEVDEKLRLLWVEIYVNAVTDRQYARLAYEDLIQKVLVAPENHGLYGDKVAKYLERMSKSNDQMLALAVQIAEHQSTAEPIDPDTLYKQIKDAS